MLGKTRFLLIGATLGILFSAGSLEAYQISVKQKPGKMRIGSVDPDSMYERAGLERNDIIREINGKKVDDSVTVKALDQALESGGTLVIERKGKMIKLKVKAIPENILIEQAPSPSVGP